MAECNDPKNNKLSTAFSGRNNEETQTGLQINPVSNNMFDMNAMLSAAQTYNRLNESVNNLIGEEFRWFRSVPQQRSKDVIFQEYTLYNVEDTPICLKGLLPNGDVPDSKYNYDLMGLEYEIPLEVHIDKAYWEKLAGFGTAPQKKDIVYWPKANKLYQVESASLLRGFMEQETTWKTNLKKYQPEAARREGPNLTETIEKYTVSEAEIFGDAIKSDVDKIVDDKQMSPFNSTVRDKYKYLDEELQIINTPINIYGTVVAESYYDLSKTKHYNAVNYKLTDDINVNQDRSVLSWVNLLDNTNKVYGVEWIKPSDVLTPPANYMIKLSTSNKGFAIGDDLVINRPGALNFYAKIIDDSQQKDNIYYIKIDDTVVNHLSNIKKNWDTAKGYKLQKQNPASIIDGINDKTHGFRIDIYANQYIKVVYGTQEYVSIITDKLDNNNWYGIVTNIGNTWNQYNVYVWEQSSTRGSNNSGNKLSNIFYETMEFTPEHINVDRYNINNSPSYITNIRMYSSTIEEEKQQTELLSYFVANADQAIILDNADIKLTSPYMGQQR